MFSLFKRPSAAAVHKTSIESLCRDYIVGAGLETSLQVEDVKISGDHVVIVALHALRVDHAEQLESARAALQDHLSKLAGIQKALVLLTASQQPVAKDMTPPKKAPLLPEGVRVIAVASGKGGVGKSTVAVNLAGALSQMGHNVGILDADIYGPSLPRLLGVSSTKAVQDEDGRILPVMAQGIKAMSMGFLVDERAPMIWRGPMLQSALLQMLRDVVWDGIDVLVIDLPPGTGDIHLTLAQKVQVDGGIIVSTPQDIALIDARKGLEMFRKMSVPILGIVENMSYYCCPSCGHRADIFGHGGARSEAEKIGVPFLGEIPLHISIRETSDAGTPVTLSATQSEQAQAFMAIAAQVSREMASMIEHVPRAHAED